MSRSTTPEHEPAGAVILAAGASRRMGGLDKTFASLAGKPLVQHSLDIFLACSAVDRIALVCSQANLQSCKKLLEGGGYSRKVSICEGGARRQDSVANGLAVLQGCQWVAVHDGARPCLRPETLEQGLRHALEHGSAVAAVPVTDTIKVADSEGRVVDTPPRQDLWAVQTPQIFRYDELVEAYERIEEDVTDDASLIERAGGTVSLYRGSYDNIKVTGPLDIEIAELILRSRPCR